MARKRMGDLIESALNAVGITHERVEKYIWDCGCRDRKKHYNEIDEWAEHTVKGLFGSILSAKDKLVGLLETGEKRAEERRKERTGKITAEG